jgi:hypothetical protein
MFRSNWTILRERMLSLANATKLWNWSVKIHRYMICGVVATSISGCVLCAVLCATLAYNTAHSTHITLHNVRSTSVSAALHSCSSLNARNTYVVSPLTGPANRVLTTCYSTHRQVILVSEWEECTYAGVVAGVISVARARQGLRKPRPLDVPCTHDR